MTILLISGPFFVYFYINRPLPPQSPPFIITNHLLPTNLITPTPTHHITPNQTIIQSLHGYQISLPAGWYRIEDSINDNEIMLRNCLENDTDSFCSENIATLRFRSQLLGNSQTVSLEQWVKNMNFSPQQYSKYHERNITYTTTYQQLGTQNFFIRSAFIDGVQYNGVGDDYYLNLPQGILHIYSQYLMRDGEDDLLNQYKSDVNSILSTLKMTHSAPQTINTYSNSILKYIFQYSSIFDLRHMTPPNSTVILEELQLQAKPNTTKYPEEYTDVSIQIYSGGTNVKAQIVKEYCDLLQEVTEQGAQKEFDRPDCDNRLNTSFQSKTIGSITGIEANNFIYEFSENVFITTQTPLTIVVRLRGPEGMAVTPYAFDTRSQILSTLEFSE
jgi:hypothetical protein